MTKGGYSGWQEAVRDDKRRLFRMAKGMLSIKNTLLYMNELVIP
jgi:hypothetical protein